MSNLTKRDRAQRRFILSRLHPEERKEFLENERKQAIQRLPFYPLPNWRAKQLYKRNVFVPQYKNGATATFPDGSQYIMRPDGWRRIKGVGL